jgi:hypothetical protein
MKISGIYKGCGIFNIGVSNNDVVNFTNNELLVNITLTIIKINKNVYKILIVSDNFLLEKQMSYGYLNKKTSSINFFSRLNYNYTFNNKTYNIRNNGICTLQLNKLCKSNYLTMNLSMGNHLDVEQIENRIFTIISSSIKLKKI